MRADLALLDEVAAGAAPALRLYHWRPPALSLGRFQPDDDVDAEACRSRGVEVVRRPTGGRALLHGADLTYAAVMARPEGAAGTVDAVYRFLASGLIAGLARLGVDAAVARHEGPGGPVCFASQQGADLRVGERKLCGSAQLNRAGAVLQHGSILLHRLRFDETDLLHGDHDRAGLREATVTLEELGAPNAVQTVARAVVEGFSRALDLRFTSNPPGGSGSGAEGLVEVESGR
jgi:lipoate-protein ligase A